jgi:23S rRNA G2445 N2-methylase RlmL
VTATSGLRLVGPPGSNKVMAGELSRVARRALGGARPGEPRKAGPGALVYEFDPELALVAASYCRTASRVLWDLYESEADRLEPLHDELLADAAADQRGWLWDGASFSIRPRNLAGFPAAAMQQVGAVKNALLAGALARGLRLRVDPDRPDVLLAVRRHDRALTVSVDLGGQALHQRGYRAEGGTAPLRENLAAVLLMLARFDARSEALVDPMAGSATIAIEAALMGRGEPLWTVPAARAPAALRLPAFRGLAARDQPLFADTRPLCVANEIDTGTAAAARANVAAAGAGPWVQTLHGDFRDLAPARVERLLAGAGRAGQKGLILSNPPYGARLRQDDPVPLYRDLGDWCRRFPGWRAAFLVAHTEFVHAFGPRPRVVKPLRNGNQPSVFYLYDL